MPEEKIRLTEPDMEIRLNGIGKKYAGRWIFRNLNQVLVSGCRVAVTGHNGSGKSTLLQIISGFITASEGQVLLNKQLERNRILSSVITAPYLDLPEELTLNELTNFYFRFKKMRLQILDCLQECKLRDYFHLPLKQFSSGMKQKVKLSLTFSSEADVYIFDEPCSHLDEDSVNWYKENFIRLPLKSIVLVGSNSVQSEILNCNQTINLA